MRGTQPHRHAHAPVRVGAAAIKVLLALALAGCSADSLHTDAPIPLANDLFITRTIPLNVTWVGRHEVLMTRHQWDALDHEGDRHRVAARRRDRPMLLSLLAGGEGSGVEYDWVVVRATPPISTHTVPIELHSTGQFRVGDDVAFLAYPYSHDDSRGALRVHRQELVYGVIAEILRTESRPPDADHHSPAGTVYRIRLDRAVVGRGRSGGSVIAWDRTREAWGILGVMASGYEDMTSGNVRGVSMRHILVVRPPHWVFDLLTPDVPGVTLPGEGAVTGAAGGG